MRKTAGSHDQTAGAAAVAAAIKHQHMHRQVSALRLLSICSVLALLHCILARRLGVRHQHGNQHGNNLEA